jgi:hypothetical protein
MMSTTTDPLRWARLLPAFVEIMLAIGEIEQADRACHELEKDRSRVRDGPAGGNLGCRLAVRLR